MRELFGQTLVNLEKKQKTFCGIECEGRATELPTVKVKKRPLFVNTRHQQQRTDVFGIWEHSAMIVESYDKNFFAEPQWKPWFHKLLLESLILKQRVSKTRKKILPKCDQKHVQEKGILSRCIHNKHESCFHIMWLLSQFHPNWISTAVYA